MHSAAITLEILALLLMLRQGYSDDLGVNQYTCTFSVPRGAGQGEVGGTPLPVQTTVTQLQAQVLALLQQNTQLLDDNAYWRQVVSKRLDHLEETSPRDEQRDSTGAEYTRWGRTVCPANSSLVYAGYAAGSYYSHTGGTSELLCLPQTPQWGRYVDGFQSASDVYGTEYGSAHSYGTNDVFLKDNFPAGDQSINDFDVPCAVCLTDGRVTVKKFPAAVQCPDGWFAEYTGYLMSGRNSLHNGNIQAICVDEAPEAAESALANNDGAVLYFMETRCGSLPCPSYVNGRELACTVCSR